MIPLMLVLVCNVLVVVVSGGTSDDLAIERMDVSLEDGKVHFFAGDDDFNLMGDGDRAKENRDSDKISPINPDFRSRYGDEDNIADLDQRPTGQPMRWGRR